MNVVARGDDPRLVKTAIELNDNFAISVVVHFFEFANVTWKERLLVGSSFSMTKNVAVEKTFANMRDGRKRVRSTAGTKIFVNLSGT